MKIFLLLFWRILFAQLTVDQYRVTIDVQDRYVRSEIAVNVVNRGNSSENYEFGVNLAPQEFISSLTMKVGKKGLIKNLYFIFHQF